MRALVPLAALALQAVCLLPAAAHAADTRQHVEMPAPMRNHMLANMRDHLAALGDIQAALAAGRF